MIYREPAFPLPLGTDNRSEPTESRGMSLRDYFAAKAMQVFINKAAQGTGFGKAYPETNDNYAEAAYIMADAMLNARNK